MYTFIHVNSNAVREHKCVQALPICPSQSAHMNTYIHEIYVFIIQYIYICIYMYMSVYQNIPIFVDIYIDI